MGRSPRCLSKVTGGAVGVINKGPWTETEDEVLSAYINVHGEGNWRLIPKLSGFFNCGYYFKARLSRCGKSCRLRWINYLRPDLKRGNFSSDEDNLILTLHALLGNRWSLIAGRIPCRTDNEIKNYWNTHLKRKLRSMGVDPLNYRVGLTLMPNDSSDQREEDHTIHLKRPKVPSPSSSDHHNTMSHGSSPQKVYANHSTLRAAPQRQISSPETSSSTSSYGSRSSASDFDSTSISQGERVVPYPAAPPGTSTSSSANKWLLELDARPEASVLYSQYPVNVLGSSESFPVHCSAAEKFHSLPGSACGWEYDHTRMDSQMQLLDHAAAILNLEHLECFESGILPLEAQLQSDVQASTLWTPPGIFDTLL